VVMTDRPSGSEQDRASELELPPTEGSAEFKAAWVNKRREKIVAEIERNRRGEYTVPTWVLAVALVGVLAGWALLVVVFSG
jgi:hypothetical protein